MTTTLISFAQTSQLVLNNKQIINQSGKWFILDTATNEKFQVDENVITIKMEETANKTNTLNVLKNSGFEVIRQNKLGFVDLKIPDELKFYTAFELLEKVQGVDTVEINSFGKTLATPNDPYYSNQYYLNSDTFLDINAAQAWDYLGTGATNPSVVAIIDVGVDQDHEDLNLYSTYYGYSYIPLNPGPDPDPTDDGHEYHGTRVAGVTAAKTNNDTGVAGVAGGWGLNRGAKIMSMRVIYYDETEENPYLREKLLAAYVDDAIIDAVDNGADIINMSFIMDYSSAVSSAIKYAYGQGCILFAGAGNNKNHTTVTFPARDMRVIAVGGIERETQDHYGNTGDDLEIVAPADFILSTENQNSYGYEPGTSFASPQAAGVAALLWDYDPDLLHVDIRNILRMSAYDMGDAGFDTEYGYGLLDALQAYYYVEMGSVIDIPQNISVTNTQGQSPTISWSSVAGASSYNVYRAVGSSYRYDLQILANTANTSYTDNTVQIDKFTPDGTVYYRVSAVDGDEESYLSNDVSRSVDYGWKINIEEEKTSEQISVYEYNLFQNYPNPFNPSTRIKFSLKETAIVKLSVYNLLGEEAAILLNQVLDVGNHSIRFDGSDLPSGMYIYKIETPFWGSAKKMILAK